MNSFLKKLGGKVSGERKVLIVMCLAVLIGIFVGGGMFLFTPLRYTPLIEPKIQNIQNTDFYPLYEKNPDQYIFIDVRDPAVYTAGHPKGAINVPLAKLYTERKNLPKSGKEIVLICGGNSASGVGFGYLQHHGFTNIERIPGGYTEWLVAGLPIEVGSSTIPH